MFISGDAGLSPFFWFHTNSGIKGIENCFIFSHARGALNYYLKRLHLERGGERKEILLPDYICDDLVRAVKEIGFTVTYYKINDGLKADQGDVKERITDKTLAILFVHYFGFFSPIDDIVSLCRDKGISVIEDCAHVMFDDIASAGKSLKGDAAIFSLRKQFPIPDGGLLFVKDRKMNEAIKDRNKINSPVLVKYFIKYILSRITVSPSRRYGRENYIDETFHSIQGISIISESILKAHVDTESIRERRRNNFSYYIKRLTETGIYNKIEILYNDLKESDVPYMFPFRLRHDGNKEVIKNLRRQGIPVISWPSLPEEVKKSSQYSFARSLQERIVLLPLHQDINNRHIDYSIQKLSQII